MKTVKKMLFAFVAFVTFFSCINVAFCAHKDVRSVKTGDVIYFDNKNVNWDNVKIYFFSSIGGTEMVSWNNSITMTKVSEDSTIYSYTVPESLNAEAHNCDCIIFHNGIGGDSNQSIDLGFFETGYAFMADNNSTGKKIGYWYVYDKSELQELYNSVKDYESTYYTEDSWNNFKEKLDSANNLLNNEVRVGDDPAGGYECAYETGISDLKAARDSLIVNKEPLKNKIDEIKGLSLVGYTNESVSNLENAITVAEAKYNDANITANDVKDQISNLENVKSNLKVDIAPLKEKIDEAKAIDLTGYTEETANALKDAINSAEEKYADAAITVNEVTNQVSILSDAISALKVDKEELKVLVEIVKDLLNDYSKYVDPTSMAEMRELLSKADEVIADDNATVDDVSNAIKDVDKKIDELKFNRELITSLIEKAKSYDFNKYTDETVEALKNAIKKAEELLIKDNISPDEFDEVEKDVLAAIKGLVEKNIDNDQINSVISNNPSTGTYIVIVIIVIGIALAALIGTTIYSKKSKKVNKKENK